jgi:peptide/nickel transport system permease protein
MSAASAEVVRPRARRRARRRIPYGTALAAAFVVVIVVLAAIGSVVAPHSPDAQNLQIGVSGPSSHYWLGTDDLGRDVFSRLLVGARTAVVGPAVIAFGAMVIGSILGLIAGYLGGTIDAIIMRWVDLMYALPGLLVAIVVVGVLGGGYWRAVFLLLILSAPYDTRIVRGAALRERELPYVEAARVLGYGRARIMARHVWPNVLPIEFANAFLTFAFALVSLASLSFLGLGAGPETSDWGRMLAEGRTLLYDNPTAAIAPGLVLVATAATVNILGDRLYEWLSDRGRTR